MNRSKLASDFRESARSVVNTVLKDMSWFVGTHLVIFHVSQVKCDEFVDLIKHPPRHYYFQPKHHCLPYKNKPRVALPLAEPGPLVKKSFDKYISESKAQN